MTKRSGTNPVLRLLINEVSIELARSFSGEEISRALVEVGTLQLTFGEVSEEDILDVARAAAREAPELRQRAAGALKVKGMTLEDAVAKEHERHFGDIMAKLPTKGVH